MALWRVCIATVSLGISHARQGSGALMDYPPLAPLPTGRIAPVVIPQVPRPFWSWDRIPLSFHGAVYDREYSNEEVRLSSRHYVCVGLPDLKAVGVCAVITSL
jgi:hypothetical protein